MSVPKRAAAGPDDLDLENPARSLYTRTPAASSAQLRERHGGAELEPGAPAQVSDSASRGLGSGWSPGSPAQTTRLRPAFLAAYRASSACFIQESGDSPGRSSATPMLSV